MRSKRLDLCVLVCAVALSRFAFRSHALYDLDSVNFGLALKIFDPSIHQPHPPGYFLYILLGRGMNSMVHDANLAFVLLSIIASCGGAIVIYLLGQCWFGLRAARLAGLFFLFSPLAWFHGTVALTYSVEAFFSGLVGYLCWQVNCGVRKYVLPAGITLGIAAGVRPSSMLFLLPIFLFALRQVPWKARLLGLVTLATTSVSWFFPMIQESGGFNAYFHALFALWRLVPSQETVFNSSPVTSVARGFTCIFVFFLTFGPALLTLVFARRLTQPELEKMRFTVVWIGPTLLFFTFIFFKFVNSGYLLLLLASGCVWLGYWGAKQYENSQWSRGWKISVIAGCAAANIAIYLTLPIYASYQSERRFERELDGMQAALPLAAAASDAVIVTFDDHFLGFRHTGYYLPAYLTIEYPEVRLDEGPRAFAMQYGTTRLLTHLSVGSRSRFILVPRPDGNHAYQEYLDKVTARLPSRDLQTIRVGNYSFISAPISDLSLLFPALARAES